MAGPTLIDKEIEFLNGLLTGIQTIAGTDPVLLKASIAQLAYDKAERRGFAPGCELSDWLAAENEVYERLSRHTIPPVGPD